MTGQYARKTLDELRDEEWRQAEAAGVTRQTFLDFEERCGVLLEQLKEAQCTEWRRRCMECGFDLGHTPDCEHEWRESGCIDVFPEEFAFMGYMLVYAPEIREKRTRRRRTKAGG